MLASQALLLQQQRPPQKRRSYGDEHLVEVTDISAPVMDDAPLRRSQFSARQLGRLQEEFEANELPTRATHGQDSAALVAPQLATSSSSGCVRRLGAALRLPVALGRSPRRPRTLSAEAFPPEPA